MPNTEVAVASNGTSVAKMVGSAIKRKYPVVGDFVRGDNIAKLEIRNPTDSDVGFLMYPDNCAGFWDVDNRLSLLRADELGAEQPAPNLGGFAVSAISDGHVSAVSALRHELGHALYESKVRQSPVGHKWEEAYDVYANYVALRGYVSVQTGANPSEALAECFAAYTHPGYKRGSLPKFAEDLIKGVVNR